MATTQAKSKIFEAFIDLNKKAEALRKAANYANTVAQQFKNSGYDYETQYLAWSANEAIKVADKISKDYERVKRV